MQKTATLEACIRDRHSVREFLPDEVDPAIITRCLELAQLAPSNSNIQNWRLFLATGAGRDRIVKALYTEAQTHGPNVPALPEKFQRFRTEFGRMLYGEDGYNIPRTDKERMQKAQLRNYEFFGAPVVAIIAQDPTLHSVDALVVGMYLQTLILALTEQGLGCCVQISVAGYPTVLQQEFATDLEPLCGIAIGWPKPDSKLNKLHTSREDVNSCVKWITE